MVAVQRFCGAIRMRSYEVHRLSRSLSVQIYAAQHGAHSICVASSDNTVISKLM
jgi:hypothetical protein